MKLSIRNIAAALALSLLAVGSATADPIDDAIVAYEGGDYATALKLLRPLVESGGAEAQYRLGLMYANGMGVPTDQAEAARLYRLAADQGVEKAQFSLGELYRDGDGVAQDLVQAYMWFSVAAAAGDQAAFDHRGFLAAELSPDQIAEAEKLAKAWKPKAP